MNILFKPIIDEMFAGEGWTEFASPLEELDLPCTAETCRAAFDSLPDDIQFDAIQWGIGDTEIRDRAYVYLRDKNA